MVVHCFIIKFTSFQRDGRRCYEYLFACVKMNKMDSELLLKFIEYTYAFTLVLDNLCRNSCITNSHNDQQLLPAQWALCSWRSHGTKSTMLESKLRTGTSKTKKMQIYFDEVALFWMSQWTACSVMGSNPIQA